MREVSIKVYHLHELSYTAKQKAIESFTTLDHVDFWWDYIYDDFGAICKIMGIAIAERLACRPQKAIWFRGFSSQGDGACFEGTYRGAADAVQQIKEYAPEDEILHDIAQSLHNDFVEPYGESCCVTITHKGMYTHEYSMDFEFSDWQDSEGQWQGVDLERQRIVIENMRRLARWLYAELEGQHMYLTSDEAITEHITEHEYEFYEDGSLASDI